MAEWRHLIYTAFGVLVLMLAMDLYANGLTSQASMVWGYTAVCGGLFAWADIKARRKVAEIRAQKWQEKMEKRMAARSTEQGAKPTANTVEPSSVRAA